MNTTTIRLPEELKSRVSAAAGLAGTTSHGFILEAIAEKTERAELQAEFHELARQRQARLARTGTSVPWAEVRAYLENKVAGRAVTKPKARQPAR
jgi:predicted transcriptional regulator